MSSIHEPAPLFPAPWKLKGEGFILMFRFTKTFVYESGFLPEHHLGNFKGGFGYVMLVNYEESPVGPYKELLFIPGKFGPENKQCITKIYVDSELSTNNGRGNWGIPKETVPIIWNRDGKITTVGVGSNENPIWFSKIKTGRIPIPVSTKILPIHLLQELGEKQYLTKPEGKGWGKLASIEKIHVEQSGFPDISKLKPLLCVHVKPFWMSFPTPKLL